MLYTNEIIGLDAMLLYKYTIIMLVIYFILLLKYFTFSTFFISYVYVTIDIPYIKRLNFFIIFNRIINMLQF